MERERIQVLRSMLQEASGVNAHLIEQVTALREIVEAVASVPDGDYDEMCPFCKQSPYHLPIIVHTPDCPVTKARALLGQSSEEQEIET
jgi:hypothetical protein